MSPNSLDVDTLAELVRQLAPKSELERAVLGAVADAVEEHGASWAMAAVSEVRGLLGDADGVRGGAIPLRVASNILAEAQRAEAEHRAAALTMLSSLGTIIGTAFVSLVRAALA